MCQQCLEKSVGGNSYSSAKVYMTNNNYNQDSQNNYGGVQY